MNAYRFKGSFPEWSDEVFYAVIVSDRSKGEIGIVAHNHGWVVKSLSVATADDVTTLPRYDELMKRIRLAVEERTRKQERDVVKAHRAQIFAANRRENEKQRSALHEVEQNQLAMRRRDDARIRASRIAFAGIDELRLESAASTDEGYRIIMTKLGMLLQQGLNCDFMYNAICIDAASFLGRNAYEFPSTSHLVQILVETLNRWISLRDEICHMEKEVGNCAAVVDADIRAITSRSYTYGGSGFGLALSSAAAQNAMRHDKRVVEELTSQFLRTKARIGAQCDLKLRGMEILGFRLHAIAHLMAQNPDESRRMILPEELIDRVLELG